MNQQTNMAATAAADLVRQIATKLYGAECADVTDLMTLANRVLADVGNPVSPLESIAKRKLAQLQGEGYVSNGVAIFSPKTGQRGLVDRLGYVGWVHPEQPVPLNAADQVRACSRCGKAHSVLVCDPCVGEAERDAEKVAQMAGLGHQVARYRIVDAPGLDPITVYAENSGPGQGRLLVACYGSAWTAYWGAMGSSTSIEAFVAGCNPHYVADNLVWGTDADKHQHAYADKVAAAVVGFFKSQRDSRAVVDG